MEELFGGAAALVLLWHMFRHLDIALDMDPAHASRHAQLASLQRLVIMAVTLAVCMIFYEYVHPIPAILTLFGVKVSALSYPKMHPHYEKLFKKIDMYCRYSVVLFYRRLRLCGAMYRETLIFAL